MRLSKVKLVIIYKSVGYLLVMLGITSGVAGCSIPESGIVEKGCLLC